MVLPDCPSGRRLSGHLLKSRRIYYKNDRSSGVLSIFICYRIYGNTDVCLRDQTQYIEQNVTSDNNLDLGGICRRGAHSDAHEFSGGKEDRRGCVLGNRCLFFRRAGNAFLFYMAIITFTHDRGIVRDLFDEIRLYRTHTEENQRADPAKAMY